MEVTIAIKTAEMRSVPRFCAIQSNMKITPLKREGITELLYLCGELRGFLIRLEEHVDDADKQGRYIRQERYAGSMSRSFYVGEGLEPKDIRAKFENGILQLSIPKSAPKQLPKTTAIAIE